ncbi:MAG: GDP-mannose mannosyl hydrolase [Arcobacter sp.]|nr:MAG: GDP-mannose mannosyl hydrolase [Arcobacter sp.]
MFLDKETFSTVIANAPLISIDLIVKNSDDKVLLGQRVNKPAQNSWFVPGGRVYKEETIENAFRRITEDELGIQCKIESASFKGIYQHFYDDNVFGDDFSTHYIVLAFELRLTNTPMTNAQHEKYLWFTENELLNSDDVYFFVKDYFDENKGIK